MCVAQCSLGLAGGPAQTPRAGLEDRVVIVGAGIGGLATALALRKVGIPCTVLERADSVRSGGSAIALQTNAWKALDLIGIGDEVREGHPALTKMEIVDQDGNLLTSFGFEGLAGGPHEFRGVSRQNLAERLAQLVGDDVVFGVAVSGVDVTSPDDPCVLLDDGSRVRCRAVVGADGVNSAVGRALGVSGVNYAGYSAFRGMSEFPSDADVPLEGLTVRQVWGAGIRAGMYPLGDGRMYWFTCFNAPDEVVRLPPEEMKRAALASVEGFGAGVREAIEATPADAITRNRCGDRWPVPGAAVASGAVTLVGDALHPQTPNLGQGGCTALEGAVVLAGCLADAGPWERVSQADVAAAFRAYERRQTKRIIKVAAKASAMGRALQIPFPPVLLVRNLVAKELFDPTNFLKHAVFEHPPLVQREVAQRAST
ncbi:unnamed protein product [Pedinophyceae sp. YPF-701]|nr:unnamed protein product [Pedinophyceae sp. YPF-701]